MRPWSFTLRGAHGYRAADAARRARCVDGIEQRADGQCVLKARVRAAATEGEANAALTALLARAAGVPPRSVALVSGATARIKRLTIAGHGPTLAAALEKACGVS